MDDAEGNLTSGPNWKDTILAGVGILTAVLCILWLYQNDQNINLAATVTLLVAVGDLGVLAFVKSLRGRFSKGDFGIVNVYPEGLRGDFDHFQNAKTIDILSYSLRGFHEVGPCVEAAIRNSHSSVRILILAPKSQFVVARESQEGSDRAGQISEECETTLTGVKKIIERIGDHARGGSIELKTYDTMPYCLITMTEKQIIYGPSFFHEKAGGAVMFRVRRGCKIGRSLAGHFESIWKHESTIQRIHHVWPIGPVASGRRSRGVARN